MASGGQKILALIPARGGSKGIPRKNVRIVAGKPLLAWTVESARRCRRVDRVVVSTEDRQIARLARKWGAEVPFLRPSSLSKDGSSSTDVILHALRRLRVLEGYVPSHVLLLQPTSPLRSTRDIGAAIQMSRDPNVDAVVSVVAVRHHPYWVKRVDVRGRLTGCAFGPKAALRRQSLPAFHVPNGAIYLAKTGLLLARQTFYTDATFAYVMPPERSLDVDDPWDLHLADLVLSRSAGDRV